VARPSPSRRTSTDSACGDGSTCCDFFCCIS
jgi:hypothetical protein